MLVRSLTLFQKSFANSIHNIRHKNSQLNNMDFSDRRATYTGIFTLDERAIRIQKAKEIDILVLENLDAELATKKVSDNAIIFSNGT